MKRFELLLSLCFSFLFCFSQESFEVVRGGCLPTGLPHQSYVRSSSLGGPKRLPSINNQWDVSKTYKQLVILLEFCDVTFGRDNIRTEYNRMLNESGYNEGEGPGCMADYFREQSNGLFNLQFDVYGPYTVSQKAQPYDNPDNKTRNYGRNSFVEATNLFLEENPDIDFSQYDWNGDGKVDQVVYVYAGLTGNISLQDCYGHIWPNTSSFSTITTPDGLKISNYSASGEKWPTSTYRSMGIGTISHEFSHCLGLPDIYPTNDWCVSICDEWDLMDGGNFTNYGWCPPNYTPMEKMLLGWQTPIELEEPVGIVNLKPASEGGEVYRVMIADNSAEDAEYLLIENRQHTGWDKGTPGCGLMVWYVHYKPAAWRSNRVNDTQDNPYFHPVYADGLNYVGWVDKIMNEGLSNYQKGSQMNSRVLSTSPFPYKDNNAILEAEITNISVDNEGLASFGFRNSYTVTYIVDGELFATEVLEYNAPINPPKSDKEGYDINWGEYPSTMPAYDITIYGSYATGIETIMENGGKAIIYSIDGKRIDQPRKGLNIILKNGDTVRKVVAK